MNTYCAHPLINAQVERLLGNDIIFIQRPGLMTGSRRRRRQANRRQTSRSEALSQFHQQIRNKLIAVMKDN